MVEGAGFEYQRTETSRAFESHRLRWVVAAEVTGYGERMTMLQAISALVLGLIMREAPNVREGTKDHANFRSSIATMTGIHLTVSDGRLVDKDYDVLLLAAVNYRENRMKLPAPQGDCRWGHKLDHLPSGSWPAGYKPKIARVCNAVGPMQVNKGAGYQSQLWPEVRWAFPDHGVWKTAELAEPESNVKFAYAILQHWKNTCVDKDGGTAPMGVWLTAYRRGSCPMIGKSRRQYVDDEAKIRCQIANDLAKDLAEDDSVAYTGLSNVPCTYEDRRKLEKEANAKAHLLHGDDMG